MRVEKLLSNLSYQKKEIINKKCTFTVKAGPGSGKTLTMAIKLFLEIKDWKYRARGLAALSFTNVAWQEVEAKLKNEFEISSRLSYPHYIGTLDSFINRFILLPFGHLVMGCDHRPELMTNWEPNRVRKSECKINRCKLKDISYDASGNLICYDSRSHFEDCTLDHSFCRKAKLALRRKGFVTQADADYYALNILENYPIISRSIAHRFPVIFVDEAQDTSEIQMKILEYLLRCGLERIMLIGDPNQAIYEWRIAKPNIFLEKMGQWGTLSLNENWRSSEKICNFTDKLLDDSSKSIPMNDDVVNYNFDPQIWAYDNNELFSKEIGKLIGSFLDLCSDHKIDVTRDNVAVLARGKNTIEEIMGGSRKRLGFPWRDEYKKTRDINKNNYENIAKSKQKFDDGMIYDAFKLFERTISAIRLGKEYITSNELSACYDGIGIIEWRKNVFKLLTDLPQTNIPLGKWVELANNVLDEHNELLGINNFQIKIKQSRGENRYDLAEFKDIFGNASEGEQYTIGTIHSIKGKEFEAVLLILREKSANENYSKIINNSLVHEEEMRIVYVAITRPKKILVLAVPECDLNIWKNKFYRKMVQKNLFEF